MENSASSDVSQGELKILRTVANVRGLLRASMLTHTTEPDPHVHPCTLHANNPYTPTSTLAQAIVHSSALLTELVIIREWLHETAPQPQRPEATTRYWKFTKHNVMQALRTGSGIREGLVKELDPDEVMVDH
ncbi:hypothetical protein BDR03DRAFT_1096446 [Suillus americanus]|nr:hypothetical protein BDR03DRAFT_1096446 [Suillus americanus]